jgi:hypothetical protein
MLVGMLRRCRLEVLSRKRKEVEVPNATFDLELGNEISFGSPHGYE